MKKLITLFITIILLSMTTIIANAYNIYEPPQPIDLQDMINKGSLSLSTTLTDSENNTLTPDETNTITVYTHTDYTLNLEFNVLGNTQWVPNTTYRLKIPCVNTNKTTESKSPIWYHESKNNYTDHITLQLISKDQTELQANAKTFKISIPIQFTQPLNAESNPYFWPFNLTLKDSQADTANIEFYPTNKTYTQNNHLKTIDWNVATTLYQQSPLSDVNLKIYTTANDHQQSIEKVHQLGMSDTITLNYTDQYGEHYFYMSPDPDIAPPDIGPDIPEPPADTDPIALTSNASQNFYDMIDLQPPQSTQCENPNCALGYHHEIDTSEITSFTLNITSYITKEYNDEPLRAYSLGLSVNPRIPITSSITRSSNTLYEYNIEELKLIAYSTNKTITTNKDNSITWTCTATIDQTVTNIKQTLLKGDYAPKYKLSDTITIVNPVTNETVATIPWSDLIQDPTDMSLSIKTTDSTGSTQTYEVLDLKNILTNDLWENYAYTTTKNNNTLDINLYSQHTTKENKYNDNCYTGPGDGSLKGYCTCWSDNSKTTIITLEYTTTEEQLKELTTKYPGCKLVNQIELQIQPPSNPNEWQSITSSTETYNISDDLKDPSVTYFQVTKLWANDDESTRPESIEVTLLENNTPINTIKLSENNNWTYTWTELDMTKKYTIIENTDVPDYITEYEYIDKAHVNIINTYDDEIPKEPDPEEPDPDEPKETQPKMPETGSIGIMPILLLGALFIIIGVKITKK